MKTIKIFIILNIATSFAQTDCDHNVSTNWLSPTNSALPKILQNINGTDQRVDDLRFLNKINWFPLTQGGSLEDYDLYNMVWSGVPLLEMDNIWSESLPYYNYISSSPRPLPQNGWELLLLNIGKFPNGDPNNLFQDLPDVPYIVLYNRYKGVIRIFANYGDRIFIQWN